MNPKVSVIMSVYNGEKYVKEAIDSVLNQSFTDFEFIIVNDGSKDKSLDIIKSYSDRRIQLLDNVGNKGLIYSLNRALESATGEYIARMDADDICLKNRLKEQVEYMEANKDIAISGTAKRIFFNDRKYLKKKYNVLTDSEEIKCRLLFENCIMHPTVIMRKEFIAKHGLKYSYEYLHCEDFGLWNEASKCGEIGNLNKPLLNYRVISSSITAVANKNVLNKKENFKRVLNGNFDLLDIDVDKYFDMHFYIGQIQNIKEQPYSIKEIENYLKLILNKNAKVKFYNETYLEKECAYQFYKCCLNMNKINEFKNSQFNDKLKRTYYNFAKDLIINKLKRQVKTIFR